MMTDTELSAATAAMIAETTLPSVPAAPTPSVPSLKCLHCKERYAGLHKRGLCGRCYKVTIIRMSYPKHRNAWECDQVIAARERRQDGKRTKKQRACGPGELACMVCEVPVKVASEVYEARVRLRQPWVLCSVCEGLCHGKATCPGIPEPVTEFHSSEYRIGT